MEKVKFLTEDRRIQKNLAIYLFSYYQDMKVVKDRSMTAQLAPAFLKGVLNITDIGRPIETDTKYRGVYFGVCEFDRGTFNGFAAPHDLQDE